MCDFGSAGPGLRSQGSSDKGSLSRCARGVGVIASSARSAPIPLPPVLPEASNPLPVIAPSLPPKPGSIIPNPPRSRAWMKGSHWPYFQIRKSFPDPVSVDIPDKNLVFGHVWPPLQGRRRFLENHGQLQ